MIIDVQINAMEDVPIVVNDKTDEGDRLIGVEFGLGTAQILLSLKNADLLQKKLQREVVRQKAEMAGAGAVRLLSKRDWVKRILIKPSDDEVLLFVQTNIAVDLSLTREVVTIGGLISRATDIHVNAHVTPLNQNIGDGEVEVYVRPEKTVEPHAGQVGFPVENPVDC